MRGLGISTPCQSPPPALIPVLPGYSVTVQYPPPYVFLIPSPSVLVVCGVRLFRVCRELLSQAKIEIIQLVVPGVAGPHGCKYLTDVTKVLLYRLLLDRDTAGSQKAGAHGLGKDLEERDRISNILEVGWDS